MCKTASIKLVIADRESPAEETERWLSETLNDDTIYVFPEGFVRNAKDYDTIAALIKEKKKNVILGYREEVAGYCYETSVVFEKGECVDRYRKTHMTNDERSKNRHPGNEIRCIHMKNILIGTPICYELHFPEVVRKMSLCKPFVIVNQIGVGMKDEHQLEEWIVIARARAIENQIYVVGCTNYLGHIPMAFAIDPMGNMRGFLRDVNGCLTLDIPMTYSHKYHYFEDRRPDIYAY